MEQEQEKQEKEKIIFSNIFSKIGIIILISIIILIITFFVYNAVFAQKVYMGVYVGGRHVGGMTYSELYNYLEDKTKELNDNGINYKFENYSYNIKPITGETADTGYTFVYFENDKTAKTAFGIGRDSSLLVNISNQLFSLIIPRKIKLFYDFNKVGWRDNLENNFKQFETNFILPKVTFNEDEIQISEAVAGKIFEYDKIINLTDKKINNFDFSDVNLSLKTINSPVNLKQANEKKDLIKQIVDLKEIILKYKEDSWKIKSDVYKNWLVIKDNENGVKVGFDIEQFKKFIDEKIAPSITVDVKDAKFSISGGKVQEFIGSQDGQEVDLEKTLNDLESNLNNLIKETETVVNVTKSDVETSDVNNLGLSEIIGTGMSDFKGSPVNRIHNIKTGASKLNGLLIAPGEEFYTIKNLLPIDAGGGYLQELVIKGDKTTPEYGGGLCQIGTTMFRAAIHSGLKITQRRPHSYRVVYYEPAGTDATIYDPMPDLRFINDTGHYILIQSRIEGTKIYLDYWGTKDGRKVTVGDPVIYNIKKPAPMRQVFTDSLKPGEKKCTESAHNGADAYFDYSIEYADGTKHEERFSSHYVPWQAVCLIGKEAEVVDPVIVPADENSTPVESPVDNPVPVAPVSNQE